MLNIIFILFKVALLYDVMQNVTLAIVPKILLGNKSNTLNDMGYVFYDLSPVAEAFINDKAKPSKTILEIGSGFSD